MCSEKDETSVDLKAGEEKKKKFCCGEIIWVYITRPSRNYHPIGVICKSKTHVPSIAFKSTNQI